MLIAVALFGCGAANYTMKDIHNFEELSQFAQQKEFEIENQWANPLRANTVTFISNPNFNSGNINLIGNPNHIKFKGDSVDVFLPYFGVRQMGGGYNDRGAIKFKGIPEELSFTENKDKDYVRYEFSANDDSENYQFFITLYSNGNASTSVNSSQRDNISYTGKFEALPEKEDE
ncbi:secreted protein [Zunongwangia profunda SM-A87]|uniref:Secreted protein n=1 Tax=Zunongwangia profunda (strain DSM 18752 / CCTCC AB 206139 / SM-A87) TaxID=655815 RepID=D5BFB3_ZUNPS|nr:secreted protein [Zunongwangia profunda SM-A87]